MLAAMVAIAYYDACTTNEISLWALYIGPVALISRRFDFLVGSAAAFFALFLLVIASAFSGHPYTGFGYFLFAAVWQLGVLVLVAWYAARLAALQSTLHKLLSNQMVSGIVAE
jgi:hypothetical protein